jgi:hypothetical protein
LPGGQECDTPVQGSAHVQSVANSLQVLG